MTGRRELEELAEELISEVHDLVAEIRAERPLIRKVLDIVTVTQADLDQLATTLAGYNTDMKTALGQVESEVAALQAANPDLDLSGLTAALGDTKSVHDELQADVPAATDPTAPVVAPVEPVVTPAAPVTADGGDATPAGSDVPVSEPETVTDASGTTSPAPPVS